MTALKRHWPYVVVVTGVSLIAIALYVLSRATGQPFGDRDARRIHSMAASEVSEALESSSTSLASSLLHGTARLLRRVESQYDMRGTSRVFRQLSQEEWQPVCAAVGDTVVLQESSSSYTVVTALRVRGNHVILWRSRRISPDDYYEAEDTTNYPIGGAFVIAWGVRSKD